MKTLSEPPKTAPDGVTVGDGKYTVQCDGDGLMRCLRYGAPWRDLTGDGMVLALVQEIQHVRELYAELLYGVATKHDGETRHETARRYIMQREARVDGPSQSIAKPAL